MKATQTCGWRCIEKMPMDKHGNWRALILLLLGLFIASCGGLKLTPSTSTVTKPLKLYNPGLNELHPDLVVFHSDSDESTLYFRLLTNELLFNQANPEGKDQGRLVLNYQLYSSFAEQILDQQGQREYLIDRDSLKDYYTGALKIPTEAGKSYLLEIVLTDQIRQVSTRKMILVDRFNPASQQNFLLISYPGNEVVFERYFYSNEAFRILTRNPATPLMRVAYYEPQSRIPVPPFVTDEVSFSDIEPDSIWTVRNTGQSTFRIENEGVYILYPDTDKMEGVYVTNFGRLYPQVQTAGAMIPPLGYLASDEEIRALREAANPKLAVDEFWLEMGGSFQVARELIRVFYTRVVFANLYFGSDLEGWKTDRGMIYIMMGPPELVQTSESGESWVYKRTGSNQKYTFDFHLVAHPITGYEFILKRSENHRVPWNMSIQSWREGRIFSLQ